MKNEYITIVGSVFVMAVLAYPLVRIVKFVSTVI